MSLRTPDPDACCRQGYNHLTQIVQGDEENVRRVVAYLCIGCGNRFNVCLAQQSNGETCTRLASKCPYHEEDA